MDYIAPRYVAPNYHYTYHYNAQQGVNNNKRQVVMLPRLPFTSSTEFGFGLVYQHFNTSINEITGNGALVQAYPMNSSSNTNITFDNMQELVGTGIFAEDGEDLLYDRYACFEGGVVHAGTGVWIDPNDAYVTKTTGHKISVDVLDANNNVLQTGLIMQGLPDGLHELEVDLKGNLSFDKIRIGNHIDSITFTTIAANVDFIHDPMYRYARLKFYLEKYEDEYHFYEFEIRLYGCDKVGLSLGIYPVAEIDIDCNEDYYLEWVDRYGSFQCQPMKGRTVFSEDITKSEITNYTGTRRLSHASVTPKFEINTSWVKDNTLPLWESIYTSPYLLLYDAKNGHGYNVICTDKTYEERKYKNGKQLINLTFMMEIAKDQNILY